MTSIRRMLEIAHECVGHRQRITADEMKIIFVALALEGVPLANGHVRETGELDPITLQPVYPPPDVQAQAWVDKVRGIALVSVGTTLRDGFVRYDHPGSMHPMQHAAMMFVAAYYPDTDGDNYDYLRRHTNRLFFVDVGG